jgi:hypothetical protein
MGKDVFEVEGHGLVVGGRLLLSANSTEYSKFQPEYY